MTTEQRTNIRSGGGSGTSTLGTFAGVSVVDDAGREIASYTPEGWQQKLLNDRLKAIEEKIDLLLEAVHAR